jgi:energy-converting hydrogenase Eha subunit H
MELWQWGLALLGGASAVFICGAITWGIFDVVRDRRLDPSLRVGWLLVVAFLPLFGIAAWLYAKPKLSPFS